VLGGACLIAAVLWRGLDRIAQAVATQAPARTQVASAVTPIAVAPALQAAPSLATAAATSAVPESAEARHGRIEEQAEFAFTRQRPDYVRACWKPQPPKPGEAPDLGGAFDVEIKFDESGQETSRAVLSGAYARPPLLACVRATKLPPLRIAPPGEAVTVTVHMPVP
jgi:hypothetical protein